VNYYVSTPTGSRCLALCRAHGFREFSCPVKISNGKLMARSISTNLDNYALDNGAWLYHVAGLAPDFGRFAAALETKGAGADFVIVPDIVAGGLASLRMSETWLERVLERTPLALVPVQDGMVPGDVAGIVGPRVGIFVGGSRHWKWCSVTEWSTFAHDRGVYIHVGRVNSRRKSALCADLGIHSADGSSVSRFSKTADRFVAAVDPNRQAQGNFRW